MSAGLGRVGWLACAVSALLLGTLLISRMAIAQAIASIPTTGISGEPRIGEAKVPGPAEPPQSTGDACESSFVFQSINVTSLRPHLSSMLHELAADEPGRPDAFFLQEHSATEAQARSMAKQASALKCHLQLGPPGGTPSLPKGGVGALGNAGVRITPTTMEAPELREFHQAGRVAPYLIHIGLSCPVKFYVIYGWAAAEFKAERKASTCSLIQAIFRDIELCPTFPFAILGDLNCEVSSIPLLDELVSQGTLHDLGANLALTKGGPPAPTCQAHGAKAPTRRDYVFMPTALLGMVSQFQVLDAKGYDVHSPIRVTMKVATPPPVRHLAQLDAFVRPTDCTHAQWRECIEKHAKLEFACEADALTNDLMCDDLTAMFEHWSGALSRTFKRATEELGSVSPTQPTAPTQGPSATQAATQASRRPPRPQKGTPQVLQRSTKDMFSNPTLNEDEGVAVMAMSASGFVKAANRARFLVDALRIHKPVAFQFWNAAMKGTWHALKNQAPEGLVTEHVILAVANGTWARANVALALLSKQAAKEAKKITDKVVAAKRSAFKAKLTEGPKGLGLAYRAVRAPQAPKLAYIAGKDGGVSTDPSDIDKAMAEAWDPIFAGNVEAISGAAKFVERFHPWLVKQPPAHLPP